MTQRTVSSERLTTFSDAVFAVIITIMVLDLKPPQHATFTALLAPMADRGQLCSTILRSYSLSCAPDAGIYRISVKRESSGVASSFLHSSVSPGDLLEVAAPRGSFTLRQGSDPVVLLSAGIGVTPLLAMLHVLAPQGSLTFQSSGNDR